MKYEYLGKSALKVSPICLGGMMFGGPTDTATSHRIIHTAFDQGVNFIDTAAAYEEGRSEEVIGTGIAANRDDWVVATKFVTTIDQGPNRGGFSRKNLMTSVEESLKRLGTDYIDIMYFHRAIFDAPMEEPMHGIEDLVRQGKIRYFGVSNFRGWRIAQICAIADQLGIDRPVASQPLYNIVNRTAETEQLPAAHHFGVGSVSYSPLARGVLTGKYAGMDAPEPGSRAARNDKRLMQTEWRKESIDLSRAISEHAQSRGISAVDFAIAWVLNNKLITSMIAGPRTEEQWASYLPALDYKITAEDEAFVDSIVTEGHPSTPGYNDPAHPLEGRVVC